MSVTENWIRAGSIAAEALDFGRTLIKPGTSVLETVNRIEQFIRDRGAYPAFPVNVSIGSIAAHFSPGINERLQFNRKDVVKLDVGVVYNGCIGDTACTIDLSGRYSRLVAAVEAALQAALELARPGTTTSTIGKAIEQTIRKAGFKPIKNLGGHGLAENQLHGGVFIPNFNDQSSQKLRKGQIIAIEPFAASKSSYIYAKGIPNILQLKDPDTYHDQAYQEFADLLGPHKYLPFSLRWIQDKMPLESLIRVINELNARDALTTYQPLCSEKDDVVVQAEHSVIVDDTPVILTKI